MFPENFLKKTKSVLLLTARRLVGLFRMFFFDPIALARKWRSLPFFIQNLRNYTRLNTDPAFAFSPKNLCFASYDRFNTAASLDAHYFHQDLWAARNIIGSGVKEHVDVGSRIDGFVAHVLPFCKATFVDIRPFEASIPGLEFKQGSILDLPFADNSVTSLSCLHVIEHIGLGRYGDTVNPDGHKLAANELSRVLATGGVLLLGTPVGRERLCFDGHRIFNPQTVVDMFPELSLVEFSLIDDLGQRVINNASFELARKCEYGCGLFHLVKPACRQAY
jgi:SAM-dependent methyltransferase